MKFSDLLRPGEAGLYCPPGDFYIDPGAPVDRAVITHGHGDHARSRPWRGAGDARNPGDHGGALWRGFRRRAPRPRAMARRVTPRRCRRSRWCRPGMCWARRKAVLRWKGMTIVVSGDYKRRRDPTCPPFEPVPCDVFVSEATFGLPVFRFPPMPARSRQAAEIGGAVSRTHPSGRAPMPWARRSASSACCARPAMTRPSICMARWQAMNALYEALGVALGPLAPATTDTKRQRSAGRDRDRAALRHRRQMGAALCRSHARLRLGWMRVRARARQRHVELPLVLSRPCRLGRTDQHHRAN